MGGKKIISDDEAIEIARKFFSPAEGAKAMPLSISSNIVKDLGLIRAKLLRSRFNHANFAPRLERAFKFLDEK